MLEADRNLVTNRVKVTTDYRVRSLSLTPRLAADLGLLVDGLRCSLPTDDPAPIEMTNGPTGKLQQRHTSVLSKTSQFGRRPSPQATTAAAV